jgi:hypothetical protein
MLSIAVGLNGQNGLFFKAISKLVVEYAPHSTIIPLQQQTVPAAMTQSYPWQAGHWHHLQPCQEELHSRHARDQVVL